MRPRIPGAGRTRAQQRWDPGESYKAHAFLFLSSLILAAEKQMQCILYLPRYCLLSDKFLSALVWLQGEKESVTRV